MDIYWLEQSAADVPADDDWLSASELQRLEAMHVPKRRGDWRLGRWTAKRALSLHLNLPADRRALANIEIRAAASGAPEAFLANRRVEAAISLSHCNSTALCVIAPFGTALGCDLELVESRSGAFVADYFTAEEQELIAQAPAADRPWLSTLLWSAKESSLKALHEGLRLDTRSVVVRMPEEIATPRLHLERSTANSKSASGQHGSIWRPLEVHYNGGDVFRGWWQGTEGLLRTIVAAPAPSSPIVLKTACGDLHRRYSRLAQ